MPQWQILSHGAALADRYLCSDGRRGGHGHLRQNTEGLRNRERNREMADPSPEPPHGVNMRYCTVNAAYQTVNVTLPPVPPCSVTEEGAKAIYG